MVKIKIDKDFEQWYLKEIALFFKRSQTYNYKDIEKIIKDSLGISFEELLIAKPAELLETANKIKISQPSSFTIDKEILIDLYEKFRNSVSSKKYIKRLNIKVCPYCNRNYIFNFTKNRKEEATAQLDHFYDKSKYPYLCLSLYNLIPSCSTCNQRKSKKDVVSEAIIHPYEDSLNDYITFRSVIKPHSKKSDFFTVDRLELEIDNITCSDNVEEYLKTFNIKGLYNNHIDVVADLHKKRYIYSDEYIEELYENFENIFVSKDELIELITCAYLEEDKLNQRPLSKLTKDIAKELGLIK